MQRVSCSRPPVGVAPRLVGGRLCVEYPLHKSDPLYTENPDSYKNSACHPHGPPQLAAMEVKTDLAVSITLSHEDMAEVFGLIARLPGVELKADAWTQIILELENLATKAYREGYYTAH